MTRLEVSIVITTVNISDIIACPLHCVPIVAYGGLDVIVVDSVVRRVLVVTADTSSLKTEAWILLVLRLRHNRTWVGEELSLIVVVLLLLSYLGCCPPY